MIERELSIQGYIAVEPDETDEQVVSRLRSVGLHSIVVEVEIEGDRYPSVTDEP